MYEPYAEVFYLIHIGIGAIHESMYTYVLYSTVGFFYLLTLPCNTKKEYGPYLLGVVELIYSHSMIKSCHCSNHCDAYIVTSESQFKLLADQLTS